MTVEQSNSSEEEKVDEFAALIEMLNISVPAGVVVVPLILPLPKGEEGTTQRALFAKFQIQDSDDAVLYGAMAPLDVLAMLSLNLLKACATAFENVGVVREEDMLFVSIKDLHERIIEASTSLELLAQKFQASES